MTESSLKRRGYVVRYVPYRDSAAMVRFLSEEGFCSFSVRGASKPTSKAHFLSFVLSEDEIVLSSASGGRLSYKEGRPLLLPDLRDDLARGVAFSMAAEMLSAFVRDAEGKEAYPLLSSFMEALRRGDDALTVLASFLAKTTELIGYGINVDGCAVCGRTEVEGLSFKDGGFLCHEHALFAPHPGSAFLRAVRYVNKVDLSKKLPLALPSVDSKKIIRDYLGHLETFTGTKLKTSSLLTAL